MYMDYDVEVNLIRNLGADNNMEVTKIQSEWIVSNATDTPDMPECVCMANKHWIYYCVTAAAVVHDGGAGNLCINRHVLASKKRRNQNKHSLCGAALRRQICM